MDKTTEEFDDKLASTINKGWNRQILGLLLEAAVYAVLLYFQPRGSSVAIMLIAPACGGYAYLRRASYEMYDLMFEKNPLGTSQRTVRAIRSSLVAEMLLHAVAFFTASTTLIPN